ncbi:MAG: STAS domain-containing protein [Candidatus Gracilibacteria bacterium]|nr:STAS domain-containing protein [Candidatus Gracilibacteria bacterium]MDD2908948.1 STAS domain-containing protein [Candidatus Gracilibacteria bacterium]
MKSVFTIKLSGKLDQVSILDYNKSVVDLIDSNTEPFVIVLEMAEVEYMNSTAIGYMAEWYNIFTQKGGEIAIVGAQENIEDTLDIVGLASRIKMYSTVELFKADFLKIHE